MDISRSTRANHRLTLAISALIVIALALPAAAGIDQSPTAIPFGPSVCEDGREFALSYTPTDPSPVGMVLGTNMKGVAKSLTLIVPDDVADSLGDHLVVQVVYDRPGKGLDRNTIRCVFPLEGTGLWVAGEIIFNDSH